MGRRVAADGSELTGNVAGMQVWEARISSGRILNTTDPIVMSGSSDTVIVPAAAQSPSTGPVDVR